MAAEGKSVYCGMERWMKYFTPEAVREDSEQLRRAQLVTGLAMLGGMFGILYMAFYLGIGHMWGAAIIIACTAMMVSIPFLMRVSGRVALAGNLIVFIWTLGFSALTAMEGGVHGHAIAWLSCGVPLIALLILTRYTALIWCGVCFLITLFYCALALVHIRLPLAYPEQWRPEVTAAGYVGLAVFMSLLGIIFEYSRKQAFFLMQTAVIERERTEGAKQVAESANRAKDQFLAVLSHELRTPLTPVLAAVSAMETQKALPAEVRADMEMIRRNVELESKLIDDLLDVTRISTGKVVLKLEVIDVHSCLRSVLEICRSEMEAKQLHVSFQLDAAQYHVRADPVRLRQVFWNLLRNALKFTPAQGRITLITHSDAGRLSVQIADTGVGIAPEVMPRIFNAFEQGGQNKTRRFGGLGLGLSIAKKVIEMHRGQLTAFSEGNDKGATFTVELPTMLPVAEEVPPSLEAKPAPSEGNAPSRGQWLKILLVEDNHDTLRILARLLQRGGYEVKTADCFLKALQISASERFDIVISDLGLPDGSGLDLMRQIKKSYGLPGIALSGYGTEDDIRESRAAGFERHLVKPVDFKVLRTAIQQILPPSGGTLSRGMTR
jgi:signal transduction histidine kinase